MAKQPRTRPWPQLASLHPSSPPPLPSLQAQPSRPSEPSAAPFATPATRFAGVFGRTSSSSSSPSQKAPSPSSSLPNSPSLKAHKALNTSTIENNNNAYANATRSPQRTTTMQPQIHKNVTPSPSSSNLKAKPEVKPRIEVESETKTLPFQKESGENKKQDIGNDENEAKDKIRAITLAGENRGAHMEIIQSSKKPNFLLHKKGNSKTKVYDYESESFVSGEGNANDKKNKSHNKGRTVLYSPPIGAYINSNVQSVNNSLLYYTSCKSNDPGVQITLSRKQSNEGEEGFHLKEHVKGKQNN